MTSPITIVLTFDMVLIVFLSLYGVSTGAFSSITDTINQIMGPWPSFTIRSCQSTDLSCNFAKLNDYASFPAFVLLSMLQRIGAIFYLILQLVAILSLVTVIPVIGVFFILFQIFLGVWAWSLIRQGGTGL